MKRHKTNKNGDCVNCGMLAVEGDNQECPAIRKVKRISIAPTWIGIYPLMEQFIMTGTVGQKEYVCLELKKLCEMADASNMKRGN